MSKSSRKERRRSLAARRTDPLNPTQSMPVLVAGQPPASVSSASASMTASASPENSESDYSPAALEALFDQLSAIDGGDTPESPEFAALLNSLRPPKSASSITPSSPPLSETAKSAADLPRSGGPNTEAGKRRSAQNSFKHGLAAGFSHFKLLSSEDPAEYAELVSEVRAQFVPRTACERHKIDDMAQAWWLQRRAWNMQTSALESGDDKAFALYLRYETTQRRSYQAAYKDFEVMQKASACDSGLTPAGTGPRSGYVPNPARGHRNRIRSNRKRGAHPATHRGLASKQQSISGIWFFDNPPPVGHPPQATQPQLCPLTSTKGAT